MLTRRITCDNGALMLENTNIVGILLFLWKNDGCTKTQVYNEFKRNMHLPEKIDYLAEIGLLEYVGGQEYAHRGARLHLTERGRTVVEHLLAVDEILRASGKKGDETGS